MQVFAQMPTHFPVHVPAQVLTQAPPFVATQVPAQVCTPTFVVTPQAGLDIGQPGHDMPAMGRVPNAQPQLVLDLPILSKTSDSGARWQESDELEELLSPGASPRVTPQTSIGSSCYRWKASRARWGDCSDSSGYPSCDEDSDIDLSDRFSLVSAEQLGAPACPWR